MPYGSKSSSTVSASVSYSSVNPSSSRTDTKDLPGKETWTRSGSNVNSPYRIVSKSGGNVTRVPKLVYRVDKSLPRISLRFLDKKTGRYYYKRVYRKVQRVVYVKRRAPIKRTVKIRSDIKPNAFSFECTKCELRPLTASMTGVSIYDSAAKRTVSGNMLALIDRPPWTAVGASGSVRYPIFGSADTDMASLDAQALGKFRESVKNQQINLAVAMAESKMSIQMLVDLVTRLVTTLIAIKRGNLTKAFKTLFPGNSKDLANDWLVYQYGVKPLISDIQGLFKHLTKDEAVEYTVSETRGKPRNVAVTTTQSSSTSYWPFSETLTVTKESYVKYTARLRLNPVVYDVASLGFADPAVLAWEVIPFSFVIDWILPIGSWLEGMSAFSGVEVLWIHKTVISKTQYEYTRVFPPGKASSYNWSGASGEVGWKTNYTKIDRTILPNTLPRQPFPDFKNPISLGHLLNGLALLRQLK